MGTSAKCWSGNNDDGRRKRGVNVSAGVRQVLSAVEVTPRGAVRKSGSANSSSAVTASNSTNGGTATIRRKSCKSFRNRKRESTRRWSTLQSGPSKGVAT